MDEAMDPTAMMGLTLALLPIVGVMMALTPYLMKKNECFAVTVPGIAAADPYLRGLKRRYLAAMLALTACATGLGALFWAFGNPGGVIAVMAAGTLLICLAGYALMLYYRKKVSAYKRKQGWHAEAQESVAFVGEGAVPHAIALSWNLLYVPVVLLTLGIGFAGYANMPDMVPMQVGFNGEVSRYAEKSLAIVFMPALVQLFMIACMVFSHWTMLRSKKPADPKAPATSALAYGMFARAQSVFLLVSGMAICVAMVLMPLSFMGVIGLMQAGVAVMVACLIIVIGAIALSVVYGQGGARLFVRMGDGEELLADDDENWKLGIFYFNRDDPSLFLPARFGIGWTFNYARPAIWAILGGGFVLTGAFVVAVTAIS